MDIPERPGHVCWNCGAPQPIGFPGAIERCQFCGAETRETPAVPPPQVTLRFQADAGYDEELAEQGADKEAEYDEELAEQRAKEQAATRGVVRMLLIIGLALLAGIIWLIHSGMWGYGNDNVN